MKGFLILAFLSYASSDKLDLTYLPPPGSQYAGGRPEDIQTPLEFPKETYPTNIRQQSTFGPESTIPDDYKLTIGNDRGLPPPIQNNFAPQGQKETLNNYPSSYKAPTTTTSYAFTQTTTYPPSESYETTINPNNLITGRPISDNFNVLPQEPGQMYQDSFSPIRPNIFGDQLTVNQFDSPQPTLTSSPSPVAPFPGSIIPSQAPNSQIYMEQNIPGQPQFQQNYQQPNSVRIPGMASQLPFAQSPNQPGFSSSTVMLQGIVSSPLSETMYGATPDTFQNNVLNQRPSIFRPDTKVVDTQNQYSTAVQNPQQQYPGYSGSDFERVQEVAGTDLSKPYQPLSPTVSASSLGNQQFPSGTRRPGIQSSDYKAPSNQGNVPSTIYNYRPERPLAEADRNAVIINYTNVITPEGFNYSFDTSNGIHADESGTATDGVKAKGSYSYTGDDGKVYTVVYTADENGFQPHGDHLPTPPPIPEAIQKVIEKVRKEEEAGIFHDGQYDDKKYGDKMYRRPVSRYPQGSNKLIKNGADVQNEDDFDFTQDDSRKPSQFQSGLKRPSGSESATFNYGFSKSQNGQTEDKLRKPAGGSSNLRPNNRNLGQASLASDDYDESDFQKKRPTTYNEDQYIPDTLKEGNIRGQVNTRGPTGNKDDYGVSSEAPIYQHRPGGVNKPAVKMLQEERIVSTKRRPARPGIRVDENVTEENSGSIDDISEVVDVGDDSYSTPGYQVTNDGYKVSQKFKSPNLQQISNRPSTKYSGPHDELQGTSQLTQHDERADEQFIDNINPQYGQKLKNTQTNIPISGLVENKQRFEQLSNNIGYMYIPPRNRLNYNEGSNKIPTQSTSVRPFSTTRKPSYQATNFQSKDGTVKPFMTLNVKRVDNKNPEEEYEEEITSDNEKLPYKLHDEDQNRDVNVQYTTPDQIFSDEIVSTTRPLYKETFIRKDSDNKTPFGRVQSTTSSPSSRRPAYYDTTPQDVLIPGQQNVLYSTEGNFVQKLPNTNVVYSTTPSPSAGQNFDRSYLDSNKGQQQTTYSYRPTNPPIGYTDGKLASRLPTAGPTYVPTVGSIVNSNGVTESVKYGSRLPTTTYRPNYTTGRDETPFPKPGVQVDGQGRPIVIPDQQGYNQQFVTGTEKNTPDGNQSSRYNIQNISGIKRPGLNKDVQNYQTSTERVLGEDFSGPKQQQSFDPKFGYYY